MSEFKIPVFKLWDVRHVQGQTVGNWRVQPHLVSQPRHRNSRDSLPSIENSDAKVLKPGVPRRVIPNSAWIQSYVMRLRILHFQQVALEVFDCP